MRTTARRSIRLLGLGLLAFAGCSRAGQDSDTGRKLAQAKVRHARVQVQQVIDALTAHLVSSARAPRAPDGTCPLELGALVRDRHVAARQLKDPWGSDLRVRCAKGGFCVRSPGPDREDDQGRGDDVEACSDAGSP